MIRLLAASILLGLLPAATARSADSRPISIGAPASHSISGLYERYDDDFRHLLAEAQREMGKEILKYEQIAPGVLSKKVTITGSHRDFGYLTGLIARKYGARMYRRTPSDAEINQRITEMYREVYPAYLEKARGIAEAFGMTLDQIDLRYLEGYFDHLFWNTLFRLEEFEKANGASAPGTHCSLASYFLASEQKHLVGRNLDAVSPRAHFLVQSNLNGVHRTIGHALYSIQQLIPEGLNENGLYIGSAAVEYPEKYRTYVEDWRTQIYPERPAVQYIHLHRMVLDTCSTVDEALALIRKLRVWFLIEWSHVLIADAQGKAVVVEWNQDKTITVIPRQAPHTVLTNTAMLEGPDYAYSTDWRYRTATHRLSQGLSDLGQLTDVMRSLQPKSGPSRTLYTLMADLSRREVTAYYPEENFLTAHVFGFASAPAVPVVNVGGVVNAASFEGDLAAGQVASLFGSNLSKSVQQASSVPLPGSLGGVTVSLDGYPAPLFYVSSSQINFQVPWELAGQAQAHLVVSVDGSNSGPRLIALSTRSPGIFPGAIVHPDGLIVTADRPADVGDILSLYCTGLGAVSNQPPSGHATAQPAITAAVPEVRVGGVLAEVSYAGLAPGFVGVYQVNFKVPPAGAGLLPLSLSVGNAHSNTLQLTVGTAP